MALCICKITQNNYAWVYFVGKTHFEKNVDNDTIKEQTIQF